MKLQAVPVSAELHARVMRLAGGSRVAARSLFERAITRAMYAEFRRLEWAHRDNVRQRAAMGLEHKSWPR